MKFNPTYTISNNLLDNIKQISLLINELNGKKIADTVYYKLERDAKALSV